MDSAFIASPATPRVKKPSVRLAVPILLILICVGLGADLQAATPNRMEVFGDSMSDTGNMYRLTRRKIPASPPYYRGYYSNGKTWPQYVRSRLKISTRVRAFGGALTGYTNLSGPYPGLRTQIDAYLKGKKKLSARTLFVIFAGANDYFKQANRMSKSAIIRNATTNIATAVAQLANARARHIAVINMGDLGRIPYARQKNTASPGSLSRFSRAFNSKLRRTLGGTGAKVKIINIYGMLRKIQGNPKSYGLSNAKDSCMAMKCRDAREFLFWDNMHLTTRGHDILANYLIEQFKRQ
jgi:outer membrane lipase/esterase